MNWRSISMESELTEDFMREHKEKLFWSQISKYQTLSENFIEEMHTEVNWNFISKYQDLSFSFIIKHKETIPFLYLQANKYLSITEKERDMLTNIFSSSKTNNAFSHYYEDRFNEFWTQKGRKS